MQLLEIINYLFVAESASALGLLYTLSLEKGMIFDFIGDVILKEERINDEIDKSGSGLPHIKVPKWKKPLGECQTCTLFWVGIVMLIFYTYCLPLFIIFSVGSNALLIFRKLAI